MRIVSVLQEAWPRAKNACARRLPTRCGPARLAPHGKLVSDFFRDTNERSIQMRLDDLPARLMPRNAPREHDLASADRGSSFNPTRALAFHQFFISILASLLEALGQRSPRAPRSRVSFLEAQRFVCFQYTSHIHVDAADPSPHHMVRGRLQEPYRASPACCGSTICRRPRLGG